VTEGARVLIGDIPDDVNRARLESMPVVIS
jgi:hypothetical protein